MASSSEWYQFAPDGVLKILRPRGCRGSDWPPRQIADLRRRPGVSRARSTARLWLNFGCSRLARLMSLRAAATERVVRHGMEFPQGRGLHTSLTSGFRSDVGIVVEQLPRHFDTRGLSQDRSSRRGFSA